MVTLGLRFSTKSFAFAVCKGRKSAPVLIDCQTVKYPSNFAHVPVLDWVYLEIDTICRNHQVTTMVIKKFEGPTKGNSYEQRVHFEGAALLSGHRCKKIPGFVKTSRTLAKEIVGKGTASYLKTRLPTNLIPGYGSLSDMEKDAIHCAWSSLP